MPVTMVNITVAGEDKDGDTVPFAYDVTSRPMRCVARSVSVRRMRESVCVSRRFPYQKMQIRRETLLNLGCVEAGVH